VTRLCDLSSDGNTVTSVSWSERGHQLAVGTHHGYVTVWDVQASKQVRTFAVVKQAEQLGNVTKKNYRKNAFCVLLNIESSSSNIRKTGE
jgi:WD40 repeat protein